MLQKEFCNMNFHVKLKIENNLGEGVKGYFKQFLLFRKVVFR